MSAVEQARADVVAAWNELFTVCAQLTFNRADVDDVRVCAEKVEAAVRAEESQRWREGVEAVRGTMPGINKRPDEVSNDAFYETRGMENALAALAARMEAK